MSSSSVRLILFDIDGTLVRGGPALRRWFGEALAEVFGTIGDLEDYSFAGKTDPQIVRELMEAAGISAAQVDDGMPAVRRSYLERLRRGLNPEIMQLLPGVVGLLEALASRSELTVGLLTGNWEAGARHKLATFDLNRFFAFGAFGDGARSRHELPPIALRRAGAIAGNGFRADEALVVGDSRLDIEAARAHGIRSVGVATGYTPASELQDAGADWVLEELTSFEEVTGIFASKSASR